MNKTFIYKSLPIISLLLLISHALYAQPNWPVVQTGDNHTIIVENTIVMDIEGGMLEVGDSIGVFYDDEGTLKCGGKAGWTGDNISITAYGDDNSTTAKDGFGSAETFSWKVWRASTNQELVVAATYKAPNIVISHTDAFAVDGISAVESLTADANGGGEPDWPVLATGDNHTLIIESTIVSDLGDNIPLAIGDYLGIYFDDNGTERYAGKGEWTGSNISITVYGDDNTTTGIQEGLLAGDIFAWRVWQASTETEINVSATYQEPGIVVSHTDAFAVDGISALETLTADGNGGGGGTPTWEVIPTRENHTIVVKASIPNQIEGNPLAEGDYLGVFYIDDQNQMKCGGLAIWDGSDLAFPAYGNDLNFGKNGFSVGENMTWKVWKASEQQEYVVTVSYATIDNIVTHQGRYAHDGLSSVSSIFSNVAQQQISLRAGWNLISGYVDPAERNVTRVLNDISSTVAVIKDMEGNSYIPSIQNNQLGDWNFKIGYALRVTEATTLTLYGTQVAGTTPLELPSGWSILPYLKDRAQDIPSALRDLLPQIIEVKDQDGNSFIPQFAINNIGEMKPGMAYKIRLTQATTFSYSQQVRRISSRENWSQSGRTPSFLVSQKANSISNATIIIPAEIAQLSLEVGDEIGAFNQKNELVGSAVYEGENLAITIWGKDNESTRTKGLLKDEEFTLKYWSKNLGELRSVNVTFSNHTPHFNDGEQYIARKIWRNNANRLRMLENPVRDIIKFELTLDADTDIDFQVFDLSGRLIYSPQTKHKLRGYHTLEWKHNLSHGLYIYRLSTKNQYYTGKIQVADF